MLRAQGNDCSITPVQYGLLSTLPVNPDLDQNSLGREPAIDRILAGSACQRPD